MLNKYRYATILRAYKVAVIYILAIKPRKPLITCFIKFILVGLTLLLLRGC